MVCQSRHQEVTGRVFRVSLLEDLKPGSSRGGRGGGQRGRAQEDWAADGTLR